MANETTTSTLDDLTHASLVQPVIVKALSEKAGLYNFCRQFDIRSQATSTAKIPTETSWWGSADDDGVGVDTEFNATQATALGNTAVSSGSVTCTATEYGVQLTVTDNVKEDSVSGLDIMTLLDQRMLHVMTLAWEDDCLALLASLSNTVGVSGSDLTIAQLVSAQTGLRVRGVDCDAAAYILDNQQMLDAETAMIATNAAAAVYALANDRILGWTPGPNNGMNVRVPAYFRGYPVHTSGLTDTANAGADVVGAFICPSTAYNDASGATTHAMAIKRLPRFRMDSTSATAIGARSTVMVLDSRIGFAELQDGAGTAIITDAP